MWFNNTLAMAARCESEARCKLVDALFVYFYILKVEVQHRPIVQQHVFDAHFLVGCLQRHCFLTALLSHLWRVSPI